MDLLKVKYLKNWEFLRAGKIYRQEREIAEKNIEAGLCELVTGITRDEIDFHLKASGKEPSTRKRK